MLCMLIDSVLLGGLFVNRLMIRKCANTTVSAIIISFSDFPLEIISPVNVLIVFALKLSMILSDRLTTFEFV